MNFQPSQDGPERFGKYVISCKLGMGGMAEVFLCRLPGIGGFDKAVVVKRILPDLIEDANFMEMFLDEARVAANLTHTNIVKVYEIDQIDQVPYIAMEYVRGPSLSRILKESRKRKLFHIGHFAKIMSGACEGLHYAHQARDPEGHPLQIVHRDVTPQNILVALEGVTKLVDFGVARARGRLAVTQEGMIKGKLRYMAPEQIKRSQYDHRADIFSLGVCLYLGSTGRHPFDGDNEVEVMKAILTGDYAPPSTIVDGYPAELEAIIAGALQPDPAHRTQDANELHLRLEDFIRDGHPQQSSTRAVATWLAELFPDFDARQAQYAMYGTGLTPSGPLTGSTPISSQYSARMTPSGSRNASRSTQVAMDEPGPVRKLLVPTLGAVALLGVGASAYLLGHREAPPAPALTLQSAAPSASAAPAPEPRPSAIVVDTARPVDAAVASAAPAADRKPVSRPYSPPWRPPSPTTKPATPVQPTTGTQPQTPSTTTANPAWTPDAPLPPQ